MSNQIRYSWDEPIHGTVVQDRINVSGWFLFPEKGIEICVDVESTRHRCERYPRDLTSIFPQLVETESHGFRCEIPVSGPARFLTLKLIVVLNQREERTIGEREVFFGEQSKDSIQQSPSPPIPDHASDLSRDVFFRDSKTKSRTIPCKPSALRDYLDSLKNQYGVRKILDFACGYGDIARYLRSRGFEVTGVEPSKFLVASLRSADVVHPTQMELKKGQYDLVLCLDFLSQQNSHRVEHYLRFLWDLKPKFALLSVRTFFSADIPSNCLRMIEWWRSRFNRFGFDIVDDCLSESMRSLSMEHRQPSHNILRMPFRKVSADHNLDVAFFLLRPSESVAAAEIDSAPQRTSRRLNFGCFAHNAWKYYEPFLPLVDPRNIRAFCAPYLASKVAHHTTISRMRSWGIEPKAIDLNHELLESGDLGPDDVWISNIEGDYDYGMLFAGSFTITAAMCGARTVHIVHGCSGWETKPTGCFSDKVFVYSLADIDHFCGPSFFAPDVQRFIVDRKRFVPIGRPEYDPYFKEPDFSLTDLFGEFYGSFKTRVLIPTHFGREDFSPTIELICQMVESFPDVLFIIKTSAMEGLVEFKRILDKENLIIVLDDHANIFDLHLTRLAKVADLLFSIPSTCFLEGTLAQVPTVLLLPQEMRRFNIWVKSYYENVPTVRDLAGAGELINAVRSGNESILSGIRRSNEEFANLNYAPEAHGCATELALKEMEKEGWEPYYTSKDLLWSHFNMASVFNHIFVRTRLGKPMPAPSTATFPFQDFKF